MPAGRVAFDLSFFILVTIIGLNVVFARCSFLCSIGQFPRRLDRMITGLAELCSPQPYV
jgi:hypothetical protein